MLDTFNCPSQVIFDYMDLICWSHMRSLIEHCLHGIPQAYIKQIDSIFNHLQTLQNVSIAFTYCNDKNEDACLCVCVCIIDAPFFCNLLSLHTWLLLSLFINRRSADKIVREHRKRTEIDKRTENISDRRVVDWCNKTFADLPRTTTIPPIFGISVFVRLIHNDIESVDDV
jgi:hypothetical protein